MVGEAPERIAIESDADVVTAREIPSGCPVKEFRVIADSVVEQLKQLCPAV